MTRQKQKIPFIHGHCSDIPTEVICWQSFKGRHDLFMAVSEVISGNQLTIFEKPCFDKHTIIKKDISQGQEVRKQIYCYYVTRFLRNNTEQHES